MSSGDRTEGKTPPYRLWDITLILAIVSGIFIYLWATYCHVYFRALSFPYSFSNLPSTLLLPRIITVIIQLNLFILLIILIIYSIIYILKFPEKKKVYYCLGFFVIVSLIPLFMLWFQKESDFYQKLRNDIGLNVLYIISDFICYTLIFFIVSILIYKLFIHSKTHEEFEKNYLWSDHYKFPFYILMIIAVVALNYGCILLSASNYSEDVIRGNVGYAVELKVNKPDVDLPNNLCLVLICEGNYYVVEKNRSFNVTNSTPPFVPLYVVSDSEIKRAKIEKIDLTKAPEQLDWARKVFFILFIFLLILPHIRKSINFFKNLEIR